MSILHVLNFIDVSNPDFTYDKANNFSAFMRLILSKTFFIIFFGFLTCFRAFAQYYETLPKGVRTFRNQYIQTEVDSSFNHSKSLSPYTVNIDADVEALEGIDSTYLQDALEVLQEYPAAYEQLSLGQHTIEGTAKINVDVYGFGYGITDRVTAYVGIPIFDARVKVNYKRSKDSTTGEVADNLQGHYGDDYAQTLGNIIDEIYSVDGGVIQSSIVNTLGYEELGDWSGKGPGDTEFGLMYNFLKRDDYGLMIVFGGVAPTGYVDDPDILQDVGFGDGQWDAFLEFGGGYRLSSAIILNASTRYTYQFASEKELRTPPSKDVYISSEKDTYNEKLGNMLDFSINAEIYFGDWFRIKPELLYFTTEQAKYESNNSAANKYLAQNTESYSKEFKFETRVSSVNLFQKGKFLLPADIRWSYQTVLEGKNTPKVERTALEFNLYF